VEDSISTKLIGTYQWRSQTRQVPQSPQFREASVIRVRVSALNMERMSLTAVQKKARVVIASFERRLTNA
jgi:hypothetical protein